MEVERDRATTEGLRDEELEFGNVGVLDGGWCCRIRRRPDRPSPCSWSAMRGDLGQARDTVSDMSQKQSSRLARLEKRENIDAPCEG
jgi:hypothetical protein